MWTNPCGVFPGDLVRHGVDTGAIALYPDADPVLFHHTVWNRTVGAFAFVVATLPEKGTVLLITNAGQMGWTWTPERLIPVEGDSE